MLFFTVGMSITVQMFQDHWSAMLVGILAALVSRAVIVFFGVGPLSHIPWVGKLSLPEQNLVMWGGIRGAVAIALALSLSIDIPHWYTIQSAVYGVALFSLVVQTPLLPRLERCAAMINGSLPPAGRTGVHSGHPTPSDPGGFRVR